MGNFSVWAKFAMLTIMWKSQHVFFAGKFGAFDAA
jgi:hypothetical protein